MDMLPCTLLRPLSHSARVCDLKIDRLVWFRIEDMPPKKKDKGGKRKTTSGTYISKGAAADVAPDAVDSDNEDDEGEEGKEAKAEGNSISKLVNQHFFSHHHTIAR